MYEVMKCKVQRGPGNEQPEQVHLFVVIMGYNLRSSYTALCLLFMSFQRMRSTGTLQSQKRWDQGWRRFSEIKWSNKQWRQDSALIFGLQIVEFFQHMVLVPCILAKERVRASGTTQEIPALRQGTACLILIVWSVAYTLQTGSARMKAISKMYNSQTLHLKGRRCR